MHYKLPYKTKQFFFVLIKLSIVVGAFYFIYNKLTNNSVLSFSEFIGFSIKNNVFSLKNIVFLLILSVFNWFFEILKWKTLVSFIKKITFNDAKEQSLGSLTASLFTPNRIGEYGAKAMYYTSHFRKRVLLVNLLSNILQMGVTTMLGIIGFILFVLKYNPEFNYYKIIRFIVLLLITVILFGFGITRSNRKFKGVTINKIKRFITEYPKKKLALGLFYSVIRYAIFSFQFYFLLQIFQVNISYINAIKIITTMYLLASIVPTIFVFDVIIKGSIAVYLFTFADINELVILCIITIMWLLNFAFPSLLGSYYVLNFNLPKSQQ
ncbi:lysylphosphatidylglycerol synthase domain-containing protein [uncultured Algibacter sp.]|uniref:lysylphosphatidylglycerol synthase domain-containing protein n=1 Tax=uncultured Algibacter sp. TaxID=298659 RepID=UPI00260A338B|nr:lysylphosphatidylglycerol synthase domain-containing protein [uncultured Algibacter sp.]